MARVEAEKNKPEKKGFSKIVTEKLTYFCTRDATTHCSLRSVCIGELRTCSIIAQWGLLLSRLLFVVCYYDHQLDGARRCHRQIYLAWFGWRHFVKTGLFLGTIQIFADRRAEGLLKHERD